MIYQYMPICLSRDYVVLRRHPLIIRSSLRSVNHPLDLQHQTREGGPSPFDGARRGCYNESACHGPLSH